MEVASQSVLKPQKRCIKTTVIGLISLKLQIYGFFFYNSGVCTWQPLLVSSEPILDILEPCGGLTKIVNIGDRISSVPYFKKKSVGVFEII